MRLPNRKNAFVPPAKLSDYLLSETHAVGKSKSRFFRSIGFNEATIAHLEEGLLKIAKMEPVVAVSRSPDGVKYVVDGHIESPTGEGARVGTVWIVEAGIEPPRLVTAYPI